MSFKVNYCIYSSQNQSSRLDERNLLQKKTICWSRVKATDSELRILKLRILRLRILSGSNGFWTDSRILLFLLFQNSSTDSRILGFCLFYFFKTAQRILGFSDSRFFTFLFTDSQRILTFFTFWKTANGFSDSRIPHFLLLNLKVHFLTSIKMEVL